MIAGAIPRLLQTAIDTENKSNYNEELSKNSSFYFSKTKSYFSKT